jgi:hypothetical protein
MRLLRSISARFPGSPDIQLTFVAGALIIYNWLLIQYLYRLPGWLYYQNTWDLAGILGYGLVFAAFESLVLLLVPLALAVALPARLFRDRFLAGAASWVVITAIWAGVIQHNDNWLREGSLTMLLVALALYVISVVAIWHLVFRYDSLQMHMKSFLKRAALLLYFLYLPATLLGLVLITLRNIG